MSQLSSSKDDLRDQLSEIHKKLFGVRKGTPITVHDETTNSLGSAGVDTSPAQNFHRNLPLSSQLRPSAPGSSKAIPHPRPQLRPESKGQDMNFVVGLSENLLSECRRLSAENLKMKAKLSTHADEITEYKTHINSMARSSSSAADTEIQLKDKNWELEASLAKLAEEADTLKSANERLVKTHSETTLRMSTLQRDNDELKLKAATLSSELRLAESSYSQEIADLRDRIDSLNDENDLLMLQVSQLESKMTELIPIPKFSVSDSIHVAQDPSCEDPPSLDRIIEEFATLPITLPKSNPNNKDLEIETLMANIAHSNKTILRLRTSLLKLKNAPVISLHNTPKTTKRLKHKDLQPPLATRSILLTPAKRNSKFIVLNVDEGASPRDQWADDAEWDVDDEAQLPSTPSKPPRLVNGSIGGDRKIIGKVPELNDPRAAFHDSDSSELDYEMPAPESGRRILSHELSSALGVSEEQIQRYAKDHDLVFLSQKDYAKLEHSNVENMSTERLSAVVGNRGSVLLTKEEYFKLLNEEEMCRKLRERGLVTLPFEELDELKDFKSKYDLPTFEYLSKKLQLVGFETITQDRLQSLEQAQILVQSPTETFLASNCKNLGLQVLSETDYCRLRKVEMEYAEPSKDYLTNKANERGLILLSVDMYDALKKKADEPSLDHLVEKCAALGYSVLLDQDLRVLLEPTLEQVNSRAEALNYVLLSKEELERMTSALEAPLIDYLKKKALEKNSTVITIEELTKLKLPNLEIITKMAADLGQKTIPVDTYDHLEQLAYKPSSEHVNEIFPDHKLIESSELAELTRLAKEPSMKEVHALASSHNLILITTAEHLQLLRSASEPTIDQLRVRAQTLKHSIIPCSELDTLRRQVENPSLEFLTTRASAVLHVLVPQDEYLSFKRITSLSAQDYLQEKADLQDLTVVEKRIHESLVRSNENPSVLHLSDKAAVLGYSVIPTEEYEKPSLHYLEEKTALLELRVVEKDDFERLKLLAEDPPLNFLISKASAHYHTLLPTSDYETLLATSSRPSLQFLQDSAANSGHVIITCTEYDNLQQEASSNLQLLTKKANSQGFTLISDADFTELKRKVEDPSMDELEIFVQEKECRIVSSSLYAELLDQISQPPESKIFDVSSRYGLVVLSELDHEKLEKAASDESYEKFQKLAEFHRHAVVAKDEYADVKRAAENPTWEELQLFAELKECMLLAKSEHDNLIELAHNLDLTRLVTRAAELGQIVVPESEYSELKKKAESLDLECVRLQVLRCEHCLEKSVRPTELEETEKQYSMPVLEYLTENASSQDQDLVSVTQLADLEQTAALHDSTSLEYLQLQAEAHNRTLVTKEEMKTYVKTAENYARPSLSYLDENAELLDYVLLSRDRSTELEQIELQYKNPAMDFLAAGASKLGLEMLPKHRLSELTETEESYVSPSLDYLKKNLSNKGHVALPKERLIELEKNEENLQNPSLHFLSQGALLHGSFVIGATRLAELEELEKAHTSPLLQYLEGYCSNQGRVLIETEKLHDLEAAAASYIDPNLEYLTSIAQAKGRVVMTDEREHELLTIESELNSPSLQYLQEKASRLNYAVVPELEWQDLQHYHSMSVSELAAEQNCTVIPTKELDGLKHLANEPLEKRAEGVGMVAVNLNDYESMCERLLQFDLLNEKVNNPSAAYLNDLSSKIGSLVILCAELDALKSPSFDKLSDWSAQRGCSVILKDEIAHLRASVAEPLEKKAARSKFKLVSMSDYDLMLSQLNTPSLTLLTDKARGYNMELVDAKKLAELRGECAISLEDRALREGLAVVSVAEFSELQRKVNEPTLEDVEEGARAHSHAILPCVALDELRRDSKLTLSARAAAADMKLVSLREYDELVTASGQLAKKVAENEHLLARNGNLSEKITALEASKEFLFSELQEYAFSVGCSLVTNEELEALQKDAAQPRKVQEESIIIENYFSDASSLPDIRARLISLGLLEAVTANNIEQKAQEVGYVAILEEEHAKLVSAPTPESLSVLGAELLLTVVPQAEMTKLKQSLAEKDSMIHELQNLNQAPDKVELAQKLRNMDMVVLSREEYLDLKDTVPDKEVVTEETLQQHGRALGFTVIPSSEYHTLKRALDAVEDQIQFRKLAKKWNLLCVPETAFVATKQQTTPTSESVKVVPTTYFSQLVDQFARLPLLNVESMDDDTFRRYAEQKGYFAAIKSPALERAQSVGTYNIACNTSRFSGAPLASVKSRHTTRLYASIPNSITALSIATNISFTDKSMIPAITQVVIGEYLFKYYRKLGPLSLISSSRHERYFWVHPYSLTLYWSSSNPILTNPSEVKTKAMAIIRVESSEDKNPLPPGLHHKSIIVHSQKGLVKITCPTRQRHNIWLNALRYLVNRNINEGASLRVPTANSVHLPIEVAGDYESIFDTRDVEPGMRHAFPRSSSIHRSQSMQFRLK